MNVRATWTGANNRYNVIVFCNTLFDSTAFDGAAGGNLGLAGAPEAIVRAPFLNAPRTFGIQFQYRWK